LTWKLKGTKYKRLYFQLAVSALPTDAIECGLLPTVVSSLAEHGGPNQRDSSGRPGLQAAAMRLLPTPTAMMPNDTDMEKLEARRERCKAKKKNGNGFGPSLNELMVRGILPTPQATDYKRGTKSEHQESVGLSPGLTGSQLNPLFVAEMMGFPPDWTVMPFLETHDQRSDLNPSPIQSGERSPLKPTETQWCRHSYGAFST
jgi:hypothetical protein